MTEHNMPSRSERMKQCDTCEWDKQCAKHACVYKPKYVEVNHEYAE